MEPEQRRHFLKELKEYGDKRGRLAVIEELNEFPYFIRRVFYEYNTDPESTRGNHANLYSRFGFISLAGSCVIEVDDGNKREEYLLDSPQKLLFVDKMVWKVMKKFSTDNILLVLSDQRYNPDEYIRDYDLFKEYTSNKYHWK